MSIAQAIPGDVRSRHSRRRLGDEPQLELLIAATGIPSGAAGVVIHTHVGDVQVDVLQVTDAELRIAVEFIRYDVS